MNKLETKLWAAFLQKSRFYWILNRNFLHSSIKEMSLITSWTKQRHEQRSFASTTHCYIPEKCTLAVSSGGWVQSRRKGWHLGQTWHVRRTWFDSVGVTIVVRYEHILTRDKLLWMEDELCLELLCNKGEFWRDEYSWSINISMISRLRYTYLEIMFYNLSDSSAEICMSWGSNIFYGKILLDVRTSNFRTQYYGRIGF